MSGRTRSIDLSKVWHINPWSFKNRPTEDKGPTEPFCWACGSPEISVIISVISKLVASGCLTLNVFMLLKKAGKSFFKAMPYGFWTGSCHALLLRAAC